MFIFLLNKGIYKKLAFSPCFSGRKSTLWPWLERLQQFQSKAGKILGTLTRRLNAHAKRKPKIIITKWRK